MPFEHTLSVRFDDVDRAGIVYFARVLHYCHVAYEELMAQAVGDLDAFFRTSTWGMPLVHAEADYARPMRLAERLTIALEVERLGDRSVTFAYTVRGAEDGALRARAKLVHAFVELEAFEGIPAPPDFRAALKQLNLV